MIEAHVQYTGSGYKVFPGPANPNLACEFADHRTCKEASDRLQEQADAMDQAAKDEAAAASAAAIAKAALDAAEAEKNNEITAAALRKNAAVKEAQYGADAQIKSLDDSLAATLGAIAAKAQADSDEATKRHDAAVADVQANRKAALDKINATDWLSLIRQEAADAAAKAKADADAAAKSQTDHEPDASAQTEPGSPSTDAPTPQA